MRAPAAIGRHARRKWDSAGARLACLLAALAACNGSRASAPAVPGHEPVVGLPCEGCELVFEGLPRELPSRARIAPPDQPGEPLLLEGTVRDPEGRPVPGVVVYAYHTDARGIYPGRDGATRHGTLRGWARTDARGRYGFETIRPASYPDSTIPAHVHMHVIEPGRCTYYVDEVLFDDDPHLAALAADERARLSPGRGGEGLTHPVRDARGRWHATRDLELGRRVPGWPPR